MTTSEAILAYADAVQALVDALPPEADTPEVMDAIDDLRKATRNMARVFSGQRLVEA